MPFDPSSGNAAVTGSSVGWTVIGATVAAIVITFAVVTVGIGLVADSFRMGAVLGLFCAAWGGVGFGVMLSGAIAPIHDESGRRV